MKRTVIFIVLMLFSFLAFSQEFNENISQDEIKKLYAGDFLIRNIGKKEKICVTSFKNAEVQSVLNDLTAMDPNYLVEVLIMKPIDESGTAPIQKFAELMMDVEKFSTIKYVSHPKFSENPTKTVIDESKVLSTKNLGNHTIKNTALRLRPLNEVTFDMNFFLSDEKDVFYFEAKNNEDAMYKNLIKCVSAKKGGLLVIATKKDDHWLFYGIGAARTLKIPFLKRKIDNEIMRRAKDFVQYYYDQL